MNITNIEITDKDGKKLNVTLDGLKELYNELDALFGEKTAYRPPPAIDPYTFPIGPGENPFHPRPFITYTDNTQPSIGSCAINGVSSFKMNS